MKCVLFFLSKKNDDDVLPVWVFIHARWPNFFSKGGCLTYFSLTAFDVVFPRWWLRCAPSVFFSWVMRRGSHLCPWHQPACLLPACQRGSLPLLEDLLSSLVTVEKLWRRWRPPLANFLCFRCCGHSGVARVAVLLFLLFLSHPCHPFPHLLPSCHQISSL